MLTTHLFPSEIIENVSRLSLRHRGIVHDLIAMPHTL